MSTHPDPESTVNPTPSPTELMKMLGYGDRAPVDLPRRSAYRFNATNQMLMGDVPILRRMRPLVREAEKLGVPVTHLAVGSLKRLPPDALYKAMQADSRHPEGYPQAYGEDVLLTELTRYLTGMTGVPLIAEHSCITRGGVDNIMQVVLSTTEIGDTVTVIRPSWPNTPVIVRMLGRKPYSLHTSPDDGWRLTKKRLSQIPASTKLLVIERPGNPTAVNWNDEELGLIGDFMMDHAHRDVVLYSDEEYYEVCVGRPRSALELGLSRVISGSAWSKNICATSARLGRLTSLDRRLVQLFVPWWNVQLGSGNWMDIQHAIGRILNDFGPGGLAAYVYHLNVEMAAKRQIAANVLGNLDGTRLHRGDGAIYDVFEMNPDDDAEQMMLWQLDQSIHHARSGRDGEIPEVAYAVPLSGFQDAWDGYDASTGTPRNVVPGFRLTHTVEGDKLTRSLTSFGRTVTNWRAAGRPHLGTIEEVTGIIKAGGRPQPKPRLVAVGTGTDG